SNGRGFARPLDEREQPILVALRPAGTEVRSAIEGLDRGLRKSRGSPRPRDGSTDVRDTPATGALRDLLHQPPQLLLTFEHLRDYGSDWGRRRRRSGQRSRGQRAGAGWADGWAGDLAADGSRCVARALRWAALRRVT